MIHRTRSDARRIPVFRLGPPIDAMPVRRRFERPGPGARTYIGDSGDKRPVGPAALHGVPAIPTPASVDKVGAGGLSSGPGRWKSRMGPDALSGRPGRRSAWMPAPFPKYVARRPRPARRKSAVRSVVRSRISSWEIRAGRSAQLGERLRRRWQPPEPPCEIGRSTDYFLQQISPKWLPVRRRKSATKQEPKRAKRWPADASLLRVVRTDALTRARAGPAHAPGRRRLRRRSRHRRGASRRWRGRSTGRVPGAGRRPRCRRRR